MDDLLRRCQCSLIRYHIASTDLAPAVGYPACQAYHAAKLMQCCQRYEKAEGCALAETHKDDATRVDTAMNLSLDPCFHA